MLPALTPDMILVAVFNASLDTFLLHIGYQNYLSPVFDTLIQLYLIGGAISAITFSIVSPTHSLMSLAWYTPLIVGFIAELAVSELPRHFSVSEAVF